MRFKALPLGVGSAIAAILVLSPARTLADAAIADEAANRSLGARWVEAYRNGDIEAFMKASTDDAFLALAGQHASRGTPQIHAFFALRIRRLARDHVNVSMQFEIVSVVGSMA